MSITLSPSPAPPERLDPFRFGWRLVKRVGPDGKERFQEAPLTLEDALHPQEGDHYMVSQAHVDDMVYLYGAFKVQLADVKGAIVLCDQRVAWDATNKYAHGPDVAIVFNVGAPKVWATFNVVEEGTTPAVIVEITSASTRSNDVEDKVREYAEVGVHRYVIVDADESGDERTISFIDYVLKPGRRKYVQQPIDPSGRVWLPEAKVWLGEEDGRVVCYDASGTKIDDFLTTTQARAAAEKQAAIARKQAAAAKKQVLAAEDRATIAERLAEEQASRLEQREAELRKLRAQPTATAE